MLKLRLIKLLSEEFNYKTAIEEIAVVGFMTLLEKKCDIQCDFNFADRNSFTTSAIKLYHQIFEKNGKIAELVTFVIHAPVLKCCKAANEVYEELKKLSYEELFDFITKGLYEQDNFPSSLSRDITPYDYSELIYRLIDGKEIKTIADISSGKGNFLVGMFEKYPNAKLYGLENMYTSSFISEMRLCLMDANYKINRANILNHPSEIECDLVFCNYPFNMPLRNFVKDYNQKIDFKDKKSRSDWAYIEKTINSFVDDGVGFVLVNEGCLFNDLDKANRKELINSGFLEMVISMPTKTMDRSNASNAILKLSKNNNSVKFINAKNCFRISVNKTKELDIDAILELINNKEENYVEVDNETLIADEKINLYAPHFFQKQIVFSSSRPLEEVAQTFRGYQFNPKKQKELMPGEGEYMLLKLGDINDGKIDYDTLNTFNEEPSRIDKYLLKDGDVVFTSRGMGYKVALIEEIGDKKILPSPNLMVIRPVKTTLVPKYLYVFMNTALGKKCINRISTGGVMPVVSKTNLDSMQIPVVDFEKQRKIIVKYNMVNMQINNMRLRLKEREEEAENIFDELVNI